MIDGGVGLNRLVDLLARLERSIVRPICETMPDVIVLCSFGGSRSPTTGSPTCDGAEAPQRQRVQLLAGTPSTWSTATSVALSAPSTLAVYVAPGPAAFGLNVTFTDDAPSTTWAFV